jgi:HAD superfamily hydrolase (TIGR01509 family)
MRALIFDVDGTLAETEGAHLDAFNEAFAGAGLPWRWSEAEYTKLLTTTGGKERIARYVREAGGDPADFPIQALHRDKTVRYTGRIARGGIALRPGVAELIAEARARGLGLAVATTTSPENVEALIRATLGAGMTEIFPVVAAGDMVGAKKPAPDVYLLALERLGVAAADCVAFEDSRNGLLAAKAAGIFTVVTPGRFTAHEDFTGADRLVERLGPLASLGLAAEA